MRLCSRSTRQRPQQVQRPWGRMAVGHWVGVESANLWLAGREIREAARVTWCRALQVSSNRSRHWAPSRLGLLTHFIFHKTPLSRSYNFFFNSTWSHSYWMIEISWGSRASEFIKGDGLSQLAVNQHSLFLSLSINWDIFLEQRNLFLSAMRYLLTGFIVSKYWPQPFLMSGQILTPNGCFLQLGLNIHPTMTFLQKVIKST